MTTVEGENKGLATRILISLVAGAVAGVIANTYFGDTTWLPWTVANVAKPIGQLWLRALIMIVIPLVFASLTLGVAGLGDIRKVGRIGTKTIAYFLLSSTIATLIGLTVVNVINPGKGISPEKRDEIVAAFASKADEKMAAAEGVEFGMDMLVNMVPRNPIRAAANDDMIGLIFFALVFGAALSLLPDEKSRPLLGVLEAVGDAVVIIIGWVMRLAPIGVFALIFGVVALLGFEIMQKLLWYVLAVMIGLTFHFLVVYPILIRTLGGMNPWYFFKRIRAVIITAFSTSSSNATLPTTMSVAQRELKVPRGIAGFVLPLGATMNLDGSALFGGITVLFIAQVFGIEMTLGTQFVIVAMAVVTSVGAAGVPSGMIPLLIVVLGVVGVPPGGIALILGVDRILDMCRTAVNVTGDLGAAVVIARSEGYDLTPAANS